jgi:hypothetical protein
MKPFRIVLHRDNSGSVVYDDETRGLKGEPVPPGTGRIFKLLCRAFADNVFPFELRFSDEPFEWHQAVFIRLGAGSCDGGARYIPRHDLSVAPERVSPALCGGYFPEGAPPMLYVEASPIEPAVQTLEDQIDRGNIYIDGVCHKAVFFFEDSALFGRKISEESWVVFGFDARPIYCIPSTELAHDAPPGSNRMRASDMQKFAFERLDPLAHPSRG